MARESAHAKGLRLLDERRVRLEKWGRSWARFTVIGDSRDYPVSASRDGGKTRVECDCEHGRIHVYAARCSHAEAVRVWVSVLGWPR